MVKKDFRVRAESVATLLLKKARLELERAQLIEKAADALKEAQRGRVPPYRFAAMLAEMDPRDYLSGEETRRLVALDDEIVALAEALSRPVTGWPRVSREDAEAEAAERAVIRLH